LSIRRHCKYLYDFFSQSSPSSMIVGSRNEKWPRQQTNDLS